MIFDVAHINRSIIKIIHLGVCFIGLFINKFKYYKKKAYKFNFAKLENINHMQQFKFFFRQY